MHTVAFMPPPMSGLISSTAVNAPAVTNGTPPQQFDEASMVQLCTMLNTLGGVYATQGWQAVQQQGQAMLAQNPQLLASIGPAMLSNPQVGDRLSGCTMDGYYQARVKKEQPGLKGAAVGGLVGVAVGVVIGLLAARH